MIAAIKGRLEYMGVDSLIVAVGGISVRVLVPSVILSELQIDQEVKLYTYLHVREDQLALYGFAQPAQLELFEMLIGITGVGPRAALNVLSYAASDAIHLAIAQNDADFLKKVPGIGAKTASRIILELKGKLVEVSSPIKKPVASSKNSTAALERLQVIEALGNLGYTSAEVQTALATLPPDHTLNLEEQVLAVLRYLGQ